RIEAAAPPDERTLIQQIRTGQDDAMAVVADIANSIREGKVEGAIHTQGTRLDPVYHRIDGLVRQVVNAEEKRMADLRENVKAANHRSLYVIGAFATLAIILALLFGFVISWSFILPVQEAHRFLGQVAAGNFGVAVKIPNRDEFGELGENMNRMSQDLLRLDQQQRADAAELRNLNERLAQASRAKSEFLASMRRELGSALKTILAFTKLVGCKTYRAVREAPLAPLPDN